MRKEHNGWLLVIGEELDTRFTKSNVAFHPLYEGQNYQEFDTEEEMYEFCTVEKYNEWLENLK